MDRPPKIEDLLAVDPRDTGCAGGFDIVDQYVELELAGENAAARFPGFAAHMRSCPACRADHAGLLAAAEPDENRARDRPG
jgi:hypothetical protein